MQKPTYRSARGSANQDEDTTLFMASQRGTPAEKLARLEERAKKAHPSYRPGKYVEVRE